MSALPDYPAPLANDIGDAIEPFEIAVPDAALDDLKARLARTRWPDAETVGDTSQGVPLEMMRALVDQWQSDYDWRACEARLNALPHYRTRIDGLGIHFIHVRSAHEDALPLIMTHGWPGSVLEFLDIIGPLTDPTAHGGEPQDAFHLILPSLPGYGFSQKPTEPGWNVARIADAWGTLMTRLGYDHYVAQGGDWGAMVTRAMAARPVPGLAGIHLNLLLVPPPGDADMNAPEAKRWSDRANAYQKEGIAYAIQQATRPQTLGYALADSPVGQAAWIYEKFLEWTDGPPDSTGGICMTRLLDNISLYWLSGTATSAARLYWESFADKTARVSTDLPVAATIFPGELSLPPRDWAEKIFPNLVYYEEAEKGGHFAAMEQPETFLCELRTAFCKIRTTIGETDTVFRSRS